MIPSLTPFNLIREVLTTQVCSTSVDRYVIPTTQVHSTYKDIPLRNPIKDSQEDIPHSPYPPQEAEQPAECVSPGDEVSLAEAQLLSDPASNRPFLAQTFHLESTNPVVDNYSGARKTNENRDQNCQSEYPKNLDGSDRLPWDTNKRGVFDSEFEKHMARSLMQYPAYQNLMFGELITKVRKHISAGRYDLKRRDELLLEWEAMQQHQNADPSTSTASTMTAKAAARRAKIRSALYS